MILEEKILWVRSSIWNSSSLLRRWFQDCAVCTHPCLTLPTGLWRWPNQIDARVKANVHDRRRARVLPIEGLLKSYRLAGGWTLRTVRPENSDTSHVLRVIPRQSHCQDCPSSSLSHWRNRQGGNSKQKTSPINMVWREGGFPQVDSNFNGRILAQRSEGEVAALDGNLPTCVCLEVCM